MLGQRQPAEPHGDPRRQDGEVEPPPCEQAEAARDAQNLDDAHCLAPGGCCRRILPCADAGRNGGMTSRRSEEHTSELQSLTRISYAVFCSNKKKFTTLHISILLFTDPFLLL